MAKRNKNQKSIVSHVKAQRGLDRKEFFENGGDFRRWIPARIVVPDKKKRANKKACRGKWCG
tara:strand:+ start:4004 stop:4189 length:186 start_codon:yes stop_codon:yes gene_type:complete